MKRLLAAAAVLLARPAPRTAVVELRATLEDETPEGDLVGTIRFRGDEKDGHYLRAVRVPFAHLVPRLPYAASNPPDDFDRYNLMMAGYSRNGLGLPTGSPGDEIAHFETDFVETVAWTLAGDYRFVPSPTARPLRVGIVNIFIRAHPFAPEPHRAIVIPRSSGSRPSSGTV